MSALGTGRLIEVSVRDHGIPFFVRLIERLFREAACCLKGQTRAKEQRDETASSVIVAQSESVQREAWGSKMLSQD